MDQPVLAPEKEGKIRLTILIVSIAIPVVVALLILVPQTGKLGNLDVSALPHLNALLNSLTAGCLLLALAAIKNNKQKLHRNLMLTAVGLSAFFLISYVLYHFQGAQTKFGDLNADGILSATEVTAAGALRYFYYFILLTHILLSVVVVPLVLFSVYFAISGQLSKHKSLVKYAYPVWLYVAVTGVTVYFLIRPYYL